MSETLSPDTIIGQYRVLSKIGEGGMGEVYRARDMRLNREVAIKVLTASFAQDADRLHRFEQEARATVALNHPNILTVYDIGTHEGRLISSRNCSTEKNCANTKHLLNVR